MKIKIFLIVIWCIAFSNYITAQEKTSNQPTKMYIVNEEEFCEKDINSLDTKRIKTINCKVSEEEKARLVKKYGDKAKNSTIIEITLYTDEELKTKKQMSPQEAVEIEKKQAQTFAQQQKESTLVDTGAQAPDFTVEMLNGQKIRLSELKGKVVLLNFWATWCGPCMKEFLEIPEKIIQPFNDKDFVFLPISRGETKDAVLKKMEELKSKGILFNVGLDPEKKIYDLYATKFIPRNVLIDKNGKIVSTSIGYQEEKLDEMVNKIKELLNQ